MVRDLPHVEGDSLFRQQILQRAAQEMQRWERERQEDTGPRAGRVSKALILCGVALLIFLCGYVAGQYTSGLSPAGSSSASVHETNKH